MVREMDNQDDTMANVRTNGDILLKLFILKLSVGIATGHLGSLRRMPRRHHMWFVVASLLFPLTPLVDFVFNVLRTAWNVAVDREREWKYILGAIGGMYTTANPSSSVRLPLIYIRSSHLQNEGGGSKSYLQIGRLIVLLAFTAQVIATLFLLIRRIENVGIGGFHPDEHALYCAISGLAVAVESLILQCTEQEWTVSEPYVSFEIMRSSVDDFAEQHWLLVTVASSLITWVILLVYTYLNFWAAFSLSFLAWLAVAFECEVFRGWKIEKWFRFLFGKLGIRYAGLGGWIWLVVEYVWFLPWCKNLGNVDSSWSDPLSDKLFVF